MDILLHAALKAKDALDAASASTSFNYCHLSSAGAPYSVVYNNTGIDTPISDTWKTDLDEFIGSPTTYGLKVCDSSGNFRCNVSCVWCTPPGVSSVTVQLWGPGGPSASNCCCGGSAWGMNGAYAAFKINVCPGQCLCMCSGCAVCCRPQQSQGYFGGTPTVFCTCDGINNYCACAGPGTSCICWWSADASSQGASGHSCVLQYPTGSTADACGPSSCSGWSYCWDSSDDNIDIKPLFSSYVVSRLLGNGDWNTVSTGYRTIPGIYPCHYIPFGGGGNGFTSINAPVPRFESYVCSITFLNSVTCHGCTYDATAGILQIPSVGGGPGITSGGCDACYGGIGRMGMICLMWECS